MAYHAAISIKPHIKGNVRPADFMLFPEQGDEQSFDDRLDRALEAAARRAAIADKRRS